MQHKIQNNMCTQAKEAPSTESDIKRNELIANIKNITNASYVPAPIEEYYKLNEPHRSDAIRLLNMRKRNWEGLIANKLSAISC